MVIAEIGADTDLGIHEICLIAIPLVRHEELGLVEGRGQS